MRCAAAPASRRAPASPEAARPRARPPRRRCRNRHRRRLEAERRESSAAEFCACAAASDGDGERSDTPETSPLASRLGGRRFVSIPVFAFIFVRVRLHLHQRDVYLRLRPRLGVGVGVRSPSSATCSRRRGLSERSPRRRVLWTRALPRRFSRPRSPSPRHPPLGISPGGGHGPVERAVFQRLPRHLLHRLGVTQRHLHRGHAVPENFPVPAGFRRGSLRNAGFALPRTETSVCASSRVLKLLTPCRVS